MEALSGSLEHFLPVQILRLLQMIGATGRLQFVHQQERANVYVVRGHPTFANTTATHSRLGDVLIERGLVRPEAIELTAAVQEDDPGLRLGQLLVANGLVSQEHVQFAVLEVQLRIVCQILLWQRGEFTFFPNERVKSEDITLALDLDRLIVDALSEAVPSRVLTRSDLAA